MAKAEQSIFKQGLDLYRYRQGNEYTYLEATIMRILFVSFMLLTVKSCQPKQPLPLGLAKYMDLSPFCVSETFEKLQPLYLFLCIMYSFGQLKLISLGFLLFFTVCTNTVNNSGGAVYHGNQLIGMVLLVQFIGQLRFTFEEHVLKQKQDPRENDGKQIWWTQQVLAGAYLVCALTKQILTGGQWLQRAKYLAMGLLSINERAVVTFGSGGSALTPGLIDYLLIHPILCSWFFAPGFIFEFIFPFFLYNRFTLLIGGIMLLTMHLLINYFMRLEFGAFKIILLAYCINVPFWFKYIQDMIYIRNGKTVQQLQKEEEQELEERGSPPSIPKNLPKEKPSLSWISILQRIWNKTPLKVMIFIVITCLLVKEFFPFSNFPMFGAPRDITGYFQVRTKDDVVLTQNEYFSWTLAKVSKFFRSYCKDHYGPDWVESKKKEFACGNHTLDTLMKIRAIPSKINFLNSNLPLKLIKVEFVFNHENSTISRSERLVGLYP